MGIWQLSQAIFGYSPRQFVGSLLFFAAVLGAAVGCSRKSTPEPDDAQKGAAAANAETTPRTPRTYDLKKPVVEIDTSLGKITVTLEGELARGTVRNFLNYANDGFYDNTLVHYVDPGKMILAGGYTAEHKVKPTGTSIRNEAHN